MDPLARAFFYDLDSLLSTALAGAVAEDELPAFLGVLEEARTTAAVLGYNYPGSEWYLDSYALLTDEDLRDPDDESWVESTWDWVF